MCATVRLWLCILALLSVLIGAAAQEDGVREIRSGADFAAGFADPMATQLVIMERWIRITDADWSLYTLPIIANRNVSGWLGDWACKCQTKGYASLRHLVPVGLPTEGACAEELT